MVFSPAFPRVISPVFDRAGRPYASLLSGLVSWWTLDETSGNRADSHGSNTLTEYDGSAGSISYATGKKGNAVDLTNTNSNTINSGDFLQVSDNVPLSITGALSISCWINLDAYNGYEEGIVSKYQYTSNLRAYALRVFNAGSGVKVQFLISSDGTSASTVTLTGGTTISEDTWYHVVARYSPSTRMEIFLNGSTDGNTTSSIPASIYDNALSLQVGSTYNDLQACRWSFNGLIDEVALYSKYLSDAEIGWLNNSGNGLTYKDI